VLANALHFVAESVRVLQSLVRWLRPGGAVVLIEYDRRCRLVGDFLRERNTRSSRSRRLYNAHPPNQGRDP
jgi:hypothetical protein